MGPLMCSHLTDCLIARPLRLHDGTSKPLSLLGFLEVLRTFEAQPCQGLEAGSQWLVSIGIGYLDPQSMQNHGLLGCFWWLWAIILHTLGV